MSLMRYQEIKRLLTLSNPTIDLTDVRIQGVQISPDVAMLIANELRARYTTLLSKILSDTKSSALAEVNSRILTSQTTLDDLRALKQEIQSP